MGLELYLYDGNTQIEEKSDKYPHHAFHKIKTIETFDDAPALAQKDAMAWALTEKKKENHYNYETRVDPNHGTLGWAGFHEPLKVVAILPVTLPEQLSESAKAMLTLLGHPIVTSGVHIVYEVEGLIQHLIEIAEICEEFIQKALTLREPRISRFYR